MTRKEMITKCVDEQIERGIIEAEGRRYQIYIRLKGCGIIKPMKKEECEKWYKEVFEK